MKFTFAVFIGIWLIMLWVFKKSKEHLEILLAIPSYFIMMLGSYALMNIGYSVLKLKAHDEDKESLVADIDRAKAALATKLK
jgi:carbon starvation protein CstA